MDVLEAAVLGDSDVVAFADRQHLASEVARVLFSCRDVKEVAVAVSELLARIGIDEDGERPAVCVQLVDV